MHPGKLLISLGNLRRAKNSHKPRESVQGHAIWQVQTQNRHVSETCMFSEEHKCIMSPVPFGQLLFSTIEMSAVQGVYQALWLLENHICWQYTSHIKSAGTETSWPDPLSTSVQVYRNTHGEWTLHKNTFPLLLGFYTWESKTTTIGLNGDAQSCHGQGTRIFWEHPEHFDSPHWQACGPNHRTSVSYLSIKQWNVALNGTLD
jgi:hypothetical protein